MSSATQRLSVDSSAAAAAERSLIHRRSALDSQHSDQTAGRQQGSQQRALLFFQLSGHELPCGPIPLEGLSTASQTVQLWSPSFTCTDTSLHISRMTAANFTDSYHTAGGSPANRVCSIGGSGVGAACCCSAAPATWRLHSAAALWHMPAQCNRHAAAVWLAVSTSRGHHY